MCFGDLYMLQFDLILWEGVKPYCVYWSAGYCCNLQVWQSVSIYIDSGHVNVGGIFLTFKEYSFKMHWYINEMAGFHMCSFLLPDYVCCFCVTFYLLLIPSAFLGYFILPVHFCFFFVNMMQDRHPEASGFATLCNSFVFQVDIQCTYNYTYFGICICLYVL
jgi:hypothetical protein